MNTDAAETHFPTAHLRLVERPAPPYHNGQAIWRERVFQQRWLPILPTAGLEPEWRDVPMVMENADG